MDEREQERYRPWADLPRRRCYYAREGPYMSPEGEKYLGVGRSRSIGWGGVAEYHPFEKGSMKRKHVFPGDELDGKRVRGYAPK